MGCKAVGVLRRLLLPSYSDWLFAALVAWLFVAGNDWSRLLADGDTGWHIRAGEYVLDTRGVPRADLFSFSKPAAPWYAWEWLSDVVLAVAWRCAGLKGIVLISGGAIAAYLLVLFRHLLWRGGNLFIALAACLVAAGASSVHFLARPHVFTLLLLSIALWILDRDRAARDRLVWLLIPLTAVWANLHAGFVALVVSVVVLACGSAIERDWRSARRYAALCAGCMVASVANPYGLALHRHVLAYLRSDWIREAVDEFQSPKFRSESALYFEILLFAGLAAATSLIRRKKYSEAALVGVWAHAALTSVRHVPVFAIVACPAIVSEAARMWSGWATGRTARSLPAVLDGLARDLAAGARRMSVFPLALIAGLALGPKLGWPRDFPAARFPSRLVERNEARLGRGRVFTSDQWGDYLIYRLYPSQKVFIDGRSDFYGPEIGRLYLRIVSGRPEWRAALDRYGIRSVLAEKDWPLSHLLRQSGEWRIADEDATAVLFERSYYRKAPEPPNYVQEPLRHEPPRHAPSTVRPAERCNGRNSEPQAAASR